LQYCLEQGCLADADTMLLAATSVSRMKVLREHGCPWDKRTMHAAARSGKLRCLQYCIENGCPGHEDVVLAAAPFLPLLQYLHTQQFQPCPLLPQTYKRALAAEIAIDCVRFLFETGGCPWPKDACTWFVQHRRMDCLKYAHMHGAPWDAETCAAAAANAHQSKYVYFVHSAASEEEQRKSLDFLTYLHEEGCPWDARTLTMAKLCRNELCAQYALQHGCPQPIPHSITNHEIVLNKWLAVQGNKRRRTEK